MTVDQDALGVFEPVLRELNIDQATADKLVGTYAEKLLPMMEERANAQAEEAGARDALALAFEEQKKYEQVAEGIRLARAKETARQETAALDELGLRKAARGSFSGAPLGAEVRDAGGGAWSASAA